MPRYMSFALTTQQIRDRTKTVTRRLRWLNVKVGDELIACTQCMGLKKGERVQRLAHIRVVDVRREPLSRMVTDEAYGNSEALKEGFNLTGVSFVQMFVDNMKPANGYEAMVTRIEFEYLD